MTEDVVRFHGLPEQVVVDDRFVLRPVTDAELPALVALVNDSLDSLRPWMPWAQEPLSVDGQGEWNRESQRSWAEGTGFHYGVFDGDEMIGGAGFHVRNGTGVLEIGYWMASARQGEGIMTRVVRALTEVAARVDGVMRIEIHVDPANVRSSAIPRRLGYTLGEVRDAEAVAPAHTGRQEIWVMAADAVNASRARPG